MWKNLKNGLDTYRRVAVVGPVVMRVEYETQPFSSKRSNVRIHQIETWTLQSC